MLRLTATNPNPKPPKSIRGISILLGACRVETWVWRSGFRVGSGDHSRVPSILLGHILLSQAPLSPKHLLLASSELPGFVGFEMEFQVSKTIILWAKAVRRGPESGFRIQACSACTGIDST